MAAGPKIQQDDVEPARPVPAAAPDSAAGPPPGAGGRAAAASGPWGRPFRPPRRRRTRCVDVGAKANVPMSCQDRTAPVARLRSSTRRGGIAAAAAASAGLAGWRAGSVGLGGRGGVGWRQRPAARGVARRAAAGGARALGGAGIHLVGDPLRVRREDGLGRVVHRHLRVGLEIQQVQDRLRLGRDGVGELEDVGDPFAVGRDRLAGDAAPLGVIVDGQGFLRGESAPAAARGRREREDQRESEGGDPAARQQGFRGISVHRGSFSDVIPDRLKNLRPSWEPRSRPTEDKPLIRGAAG